MRKNREINGKALRDEILTLLASLLLDEKHFDTLKLSAVGYITLNNGSSREVSYKMKQTELDFICRQFPQKSQYKWEITEIHQEGDIHHFGKVVQFTKIFDETGDTDRMTNIL